MCYLITPLAEMPKSAAFVIFKIADLCVMTVISRLKPYCTMVMPKSVDYLRKFSFYYRLSTD